MILFLTAILFFTLTALALFVLPVLSTGHQKKTPMQISYVFAVLFLFSVLVPVFYGMSGRPDLPDFPKKTRDIVSSEYNIKDMAKIRRMERYLIENPDDGSMWEQLGTIYRQNQMYAKSADAYRNAIEFGVPQDVANWYALAETLIQANDGKVVAEAQKAFENVLRYRPDSPKALYFLGLARLQNNDPQKALALWRYLEQRISENDPWLTVIEERIRLLGKKEKIAPETVPPQAPKIFVR